MGKSVNKQLSQVQTIQWAITGRHVAQLVTTKTIFGKPVIEFAANVWGHFVIYNSRFEANVFIKLDSYNATVLVMIKPQKH